MVADVHLRRHPPTHDFTTRGKTKRTDLANNGEQRWAARAPLTNSKNETHVVAKEQKTFAVGLCAAELVAHRPGEPAGLRARDEFWSSQAGHVNREPVIRAHEVSGDLPEGSGRQGSNGLD
jgi:hypothetical protein